MGTGWEPLQAPRVERLSGYRAGLAHPLQDA